MPFERIAMDIVGPLVKTARGHQSILAIVDYATRHPEDIPLWPALSKGIARELFHLFSRVGIPNETLTDQGTKFMSSLMKEFYPPLQIKQICTFFTRRRMGSSSALIKRSNRCCGRSSSRTGRTGTSYYPT